MREGQTPHYNFSWFVLRILRYQNFVQCVVFIRWKIPLYHALRARAILNYPRQPSTTLSDAVSFANTVTHWAHTLVIQIGPMQSHTWGLVSHTHWAQVVTGVGPKITHIVPTQLHILGLVRHTLGPIEGLHYVLSCAPRSVAVCCRISPATAPCSVAVHWRFSDAHCPLARSSATVC